MLIHDGIDGVKVSLNMEQVPAILTFTKDGINSNFYLSGRCIDGCDYEVAVVNWLEKIHDKLLEIIWQWNLGNDEVELIYENLNL